MDAQNVVEPASTKPPASPKRTGNESDQPRSSTAARLFGSGKPDLSVKDTKTSVAVSHTHDDEGGAEGNSDAETIVLPGKDGHSPSKIRKVIKHEDKSDTEDPPVAPRGRKHDSNGRRERDNDRNDRGDRKDKSVSVADNNSDRGASLVKKKKLADKSKAKDGSSGLSSAPASPPQRRRRSSNANSKSDSETAPVESPRMSSKEKPKLADKMVPHKRKAPRPDSDDEADSRKVRRQRTSGSGLDASRKPHPPPKSHLDTHITARNRSPSPPPRAHRRSVSTQLPGHTNGLSHKKKRVPAPLQSTDYRSDDSSASGSPHPRSSKLRSLATPATAESNISPAKMAPHKKHLDAHGQTFLARACAKGEFDQAKHRLKERPEDINVADYAGNTPLQIAAINGYVDIVKLLVDAQCNLECVNNDKDTPLIDAVENGHLEVVRVLLAAGVNPRRANAYGQEPLERVNEDDDNADEIRRLLEEAREHMGERRRTSEEHMDHTDARSSHGPESPRRSPGATGSIHAASGRRAGTVRATKTSNHLLYMPMDDKTLRQAAARGDEETVTRILQVRDTFDDPESMVAAARGGHDICMQLLLALGKANPDPAPISNNDYSTPMLAAIGQENIKVIKLLLDQNDFNPTRLYKGETYYELARRRRGPNWADEEHMLKLAYDEYKKSHSKTKSPNRREQDSGARRARAEPKDESSKSHKRKASSPTREPKKTPKILTSPKGKRRSDSFTAHLDDQISPKRGPGRPRKDDRVPTIAISDREASPAVKQPAAKVKRVEADTTAASSEGEALKPRRKLVSGRELKGERSQQNRRASMVSNTPSLKEPSSPRDESEKPPRTEKFQDRTKALKRDESRDRLSLSGESTGKRHRSSATPPHIAPSDKDAGEAPPKKRRLDMDGKERRLKASTSDDKHLKAPVSRDSSTAGASRIRSKSRDEEERRPPKSKKLDGAAEHVRRELAKSLYSENSIHVKSEDPDVDMPDAPRSADAASESRAKEKESEEKKKAVEEKKRLVEEKRKLAEDRRLAEEKKEAEKKRQEEEQREKEKEKLRLEEEDRKLKEEEKRRAEEKKRKEEEERKQREEEERKQRELEEKRRKEEEEEERRRVEEEVRKRKEEEERKRQEELERKRKEEEQRLREEEERRKKEEEERKVREEEERLRREQLEREAAEELRRKREEEERKELERKQELERRRLVREAEQRRQRLEQERTRIAKLPPLLQWLDGYANPKAPEVAEMFRMIQGVRYDCLRPEATGTAEGREQWLLNTQVALLLGEKDLQLSRYTGWTHIPASALAKRSIWRLESDRYALTSPGLYELGKQLPGYYGGEEPERMGFRVTERLRSEAWKKFAALDTFFVKVSDFLYIVSATPHLRKVRLTLEYMEIPETEQQAKQFAPLQKWKRDPDASANHGFAPGNKHFLNGELVSVNTAGFSEVSTTPFPERRVPRRGLLTVSPDDPSYVAICKEQGLHHLLGGGDSPLMSNGVHSSPLAHSVNGVASPSSLAASTREGSSRGHIIAQPMSPSSEPGPAQARPLVNGVNGAANGTAH